MLDFGARQGNLQLYPHTYGGYAKREVGGKVVHIAKRAPEVNGKVVNVAKHIIPQASDQNSMILTM